LIVKSRNSNLIENSEAELIDNCSTTAVRNVYVPAVKTPSDGPQIQKEVLTLSAIELAVGGQLMIPVYLSDKVLIYPPLFG